MATLKAKDVKPGQQFRWFEWFYLRLPDTAEHVSNAGRHNVPALFLSLSPTRPLGSFLGFYGEAKVELVELVEPPKPKYYFKDVPVGGRFVVGSATYVKTSNVAAVDTDYESTFDPADEIDSILPPPGDDPCPTPSCS